MKTDRLRKTSYLKVYVAVLICLTTKAVHFDLCKGLSAEEFLLTLKRFINRQGSPAHIYSDNGTNFIGAKHEIEQLTSFLKNKETQSTISHLSALHEFQWHIIPPRAPHFGGLWEAAVRRMKLILKKQMLPHKMTFDEIYTILTEAEAILNSTPLSPVHSDDVTEDLCITPGHIIIGRPLKAPLTKTPSRVNISSLRRWRLTERITQDLWNTWMKSYLQTLHHRAKWQNVTTNVKIGDIVYIKDESLPYRA